MREVDIRIAPEDLQDETLIQNELAKTARVSPTDIKDYKILKRSLDARYRPPVYLLRIAYSTDQPLPALTNELADLKNVSDASPVHIIGAGPAGYFAALECIKHGIRPIVMDRGKDVQSRRKDLRAIQQEGMVNAHSNYCFGEGGAGTYSDDKLYTRSGKRGNIFSVLKILVECGAHPEILVDAHPHIGSNKLPGIIATIRDTIESFGGEVLFDSWVSDLIIEGSSPRMLKGLVINGKEAIEVTSVILATGHSARDIFQLLQDRSLAIEPKAFALGVRVEHPQNFVDACQYGVSPRTSFLPAASYSLSTQMEDEGIFSFCMCPGGLIVPAATSPGEIVVNGMSLSRRDSPFANSGVVTAVPLNELNEFKKEGPLMGIAFQQSVEQEMFRAGNGSQAAPAQRIMDFVKKKESLELPPTSYIPGIFPAPLHELLPAWIYERLKYGITGFDHKMKGYIHPEAVVVATESRTSSPVRIPRRPESGMHPEVNGLFPCGEGAGYAGGIVSAAMDGQLIARCVAGWLKENNV